MMPTRGPWASSTRMAATSAAAVWFGGLILFVAIAVQTKAPVGTLTRDPSETTGSPWYLGMTSSLGAVGWSSAAAAFALGAAVTYSLGGRRRTTASLATGSAFTLVLLVDDVLLLHDDVVPRILPVEEEGIFAAYAFAGIAWLAAYFREMQAAVLLLVGVAGLGLGTSVAIDLVWDSEGDWRLLAEDGTKFVGIWSWAAAAAFLAGGGVIDAARSDGDRSR